MNMSKIIYLYLFDGLSDWEIGYVTSNLHSPMVPPQFDLHLKTVTIDGQSIRTMGGLLITPDLSLKEINIAESEMLILPGGASWDQDGNKEIIDLAKKFNEKKKIIAAICGATLGLAKAGLLDKVNHTSNSKDYLMQSGYQGGNHYIEAPAVSDKNFITAPGTAPIEFAYQIFKAINLYKSTTLQAWFDLFKKGGPEAFMALMQSLNEE